MAYNGEKVVHPCKIGLALEVRILLFTQMSMSSNLGHQPFGAGNVGENPTVDTKVANKAGSRYL